MPNSPNDCIFCQVGQGKHPAEIIATFTHCFIMKDQFPVSQGHLLIIPHQHTDNWFTASKEVQIEMIQALDFAKAKLDSLYSPAGYNIGANCGKAAGQSVMHLHLHLIPRYTGDVSDPLGGIRCVLPMKQKY